MSAKLQLSDVVADVLTFALPPLTSGALLTAMHWFPGAQETPTITRYALGTAVVSGIPAGTLCTSALLGRRYHPLFWAALLVANALVSGAAVCGAYWLDTHRPVTLEDIRNAARRE